MNKHRVVPGTATEKMQKIEGDEMVAEMAEALLSTTVSLTAAVSMLKRGSKKVAPSDKMFDQMIADYEASLESGRAALAHYRKVSGEER